MSNLLPSNTAHICCELSAASLSTTSHTYHNITEIRTIITLFIDIPRKRRWADELGNSRDRWLYQVRPIIISYQLPLRYLIPVYHCGARFDIRTRSSVTSCLTRLDSVTLLWAMLRPWGNVTTYKMADLKWLCLASFRHHICLRIGHETFF